MQLLLQKVENSHTLDLRIAVDSYVVFIYFLSVLVADSGLVHSSEMETTELFQFVVTGEYKLYITLLRTGVEDFAVVPAKTILEN